VPPQWGAELRQILSTGARVRLSDRPTLRAVWRELEAGQRAAEEGEASTLAPTSSSATAWTADAAVLGDAWLGPAVTRGLVRPIPRARQSRWWAALGPRWRALVTRDPATGRCVTNGEVYAAPLRWGAVVVAQDVDAIIAAGGRRVDAWPDLLQPALQGRLALPEGGRDLLAIALLCTGISPNATWADVAKVRGGETRLRAALDGLRALASTSVEGDGARALAGRDCLAAVGDSQLLVPVAERLVGGAAVLPRGGGILWADTWCVPAGAGGGSMGEGPSPLLPLLLEHGLHPTRVTARASAGLARGLSPLLLPGGCADSDVAAALAVNRSGVARTHLPTDPAILGAASFLLPHAPRDVEAFARLLSS